MTKNNASSISVNVTFRHTEPTAALKQYAVEKVTHCLTKYLQGETEANVILSVEKQSHSAEAIVKSNAYDIRAQAVTADLYSAIDLLAENLVAQMRKQKERAVEHRQNAVTF